MSFPLLLFVTQVSADRQYRTGRFLVQRAINISREFEAASRARERQMRASESVALTSQADAAFLLRLAQLGLTEMLGVGATKANWGQLQKTVKMIAEVALLTKGGIQE